MSLYITNKELQEYIKDIDYKGCKNCKHKTAPLISCEWLEQGGDRQIHFICPIWDKVESEEINADSD